MESMSREEIGRQLRRLREQTGLTQRQVAAILGRNQQSLNHWESGYSQPSIEILIQLLAAYGIDNIFSRGQRFQRNLSGVESSLISSYRQAPRPIRAAVRRLLDLSDADAAAVRALPVYRIPAADAPFLDGDDFFLSPADETVPPEAALGVVTADDSMAPMLQPGGVAWVRRQTTLSHGETGLFRMEGRVLIRTLWSQLGQTRLESLNPQYPTIVIPDSCPLQVLGKVLYNDL